ncbi:MAG: hypothetical protein M0Z37_02740 [Nitrospiraceae bacterium]|nr:hypothetical protein [Nitrospiraceae bacterium]
MKIFHHASPRSERREPQGAVRMNRWFNRIMIGASVLVLSGAAWEKPVVEIIAPKNGGVVGKHVLVKYAFHHEWRADHVHIFVDGNFLMSTHKNPFTLTLEKGVHTIMLQAATVHHNLLKARGSVDVTVK